MKAIYNFAAGPAVLPEEVLAQAQSELIDIAGSGMSAMELTHRGKEFSAIIEKAEKTLRELMTIPDNYKVLFLQGGASLQFTMVPLNLAQGKKVTYLVDGQFGEKAFEEAAKLSGAFDVTADKIESDFHQLIATDSLEISADRAYVHLTLNNTIEGTMHRELPDLPKSVELVGDMSSNILAVDYDVSKFGLIYAGAQKNIGPAGLTLVVVREDLLPEKGVVPSSMLDYRILADNDSMYNTPPTFAIYMAGLVFDWVKAQGGVAEMERRNHAKSALLYEAIDASNFYQSPVRYKNERSICNVPFMTPSKELDAKFIAEAEVAGLKNIKGHRSVSGMRASLYNAFPYEGVEALVAFMKEFEEKNGL